MRFPYDENDRQPSRTITSLGAVVACKLQKETTRDGVQMYMQHEYSNTSLEEARRAKIQSKETRRLRFFALRAITNQPSTYRHK